MLKLAQEYELTDGEFHMAIGNILSSAAKYEIRAERHPKHPDHEGGLACERAKCPGNPDRLPKMTASS